MCVHGSSWWGYHTLPFSTDRKRATHPRVSPGTITTSSFVGFVMVKKSFNESFNNHFPKFTVCPSRPIILDGTFRQGFQRSTDHRGALWEPSWVSVLRVAPSTSLLILLRVWTWWHLDIWTFWTRISHPFWWNFQLKCFNFLPNISHFSLVLGKQLPVSAALK